MADSIIKFWRELKRRKVIRVAVAYTLVAWVVVEVASVILPSLLMPEWSLRLIIVLVMLGFPVALVLAWVIELTPDGAKLESPASNDSDSHSPVKEQVDGANFVGAEGDTRRSIVVLPFSNLSDETDQAYFSDGITEEILALLARQPELRVISRTTSFTFKETKLDIRSIAEKLNVEMVLEGSVRRAGSKVRIMAQLIDPSNDTQLWSDRYDRHKTGVRIRPCPVCHKWPMLLSRDPST